MPSMLKSSYFASLSSLSSYSHHFAQIRVVNDRLVSINSSAEAKSVLPANTAALKQIDQQTGLLRLQIPPSFCSSRSADAVLPIDPPLLVLHSMQSLSCLIRGGQPSWSQLYQNKQFLKEISDTMTCCLIGQIANALLLCFPELKGRHVPICNSAQMAELYQKSKE